jgi:protein CpxP
MNSSRNKTLVAIIAVLLVSNIAVLLYFVVLKDSWHRGEKRKLPMTEFLQKEVGFSEQQLALFDSLKRHHHEAVKPLGEDLSRSRDTLYLLIGNPAVTDSALQAAAAVIGRKQALLELKLFANFRQIRAICTPAQLPRFDSLAPALVRKMMAPSRRPPSPKKTDSSSLAH